MPQPILFLTGFEPFLDTQVNASGELARVLHGTILAGVRIHSTILPVTFGEMPGAYAAALEALSGQQVVALCSLGVQGKSYFRLETLARPVLDSSKPDMNGVFAHDLEPLGTEPRRTSVDLEALAQAMRQAGAEDVQLSTNAGGYVCERCYWEVLGAASRSALKGVFLHVPPISTLSLEQQLGPVRGFLEQLLTQASGQAS